MKQRQKLGLVVPLVTTVGAATAIVLSTIGILTLSLAESIIIALLALLAIDALTERVSLLQLIDQKISSLSEEQALRPRDKILQPREYARSASEICITGISASSMTNQDMTFYKEKMTDGCNIKILILDPDSEAVQVYQDLRSMAVNPRYFIACLVFFLHI